MEDISINLLQLSADFSAGKRAKTLEHFSQRDYITCNEWTRTERDFVFVVFSPNPTHSSLRNNILVSLKTPQNLAHISGGSIYVLALTVIRLGIHI